MSKTVSTRLNEKELNKLDEISSKENLDRSTLIRKFVIEQIKNYEMKKMGEFYRKGIVSLQEAAFTANVTLYEMMDYIRREEIHPPDQSPKEIQIEIEDAINYYE
ncbi:MAG: hypothetical protein ACTSRK_02175 [Promethearchaeota archaeon]